MTKWRLVFIVLFLLLFSGAVRTVSKHREGLTRVEALKAEVEKLETERRALGEEKAYRETTAFVEKEARDKLKMVKEGERLVVLPEKLPVLGAEATSPSERAWPVWRQWWTVFFGKQGE